jgi:hypothetical protein
MTATTRRPDRSLIRAASSTTPPLVAATLDNGTVFELSPPSAGETQWTETVLYSFGLATVSFQGRPDHGSERRALRNDCLWRELWLRHVIQAGPIA